MISDLLRDLDDPIGSKARDLTTYPDVTGYHVTRKANADSIVQTGIKAHSSKQSYDRPAAVYMFLDLDDVSIANVDILGLGSEDICVVKVCIPSDYVKRHMRWDALYNVTFGTSYSAVQYLDDIPAEWVSIVSKH